MICPVCGSSMPEPHVDVVRVGGTVYRDGEVGVPRKAEVSECPNQCGYLYCKIIEEAVG